ncbi:malate synthase G (plasmid) [Pseudoalteromonas xiamenensis]|uniref:malate synthase G n=1 Tax=Pseudoalteromonas xiamenensis TaxID=882626 RepID=UPI0027E3B6FB|nr:malate synthase G [Pseudoalteromonas xiamenensis]WMN62034.1 malate synthase G [Pseudoalteromonas xiamenensis]
MTNMVQHAGLSIHPALYQFINQEALPGTGIAVDAFWSKFASLIISLSPINRALLAKRDDLQNKIDEFHRANSSYSMDEYRTFLEAIGYLVNEPAPFAIQTEHVEPEIALTAAPQLVVPVSNARFALNAANARWGSLYDALYGTDVLSEEDGAERTNSYNPVRGFKVMAYARQFLDKVLPLVSGSHIESTNYALINEELVVTLRDSTQVKLANPEQFIGFQGQINAPTCLLFKHNGLHIEIQFDPFHPVGAADKAGIKDVVLEAAATTIMDCEDSVAAVDAEDKVGVYRNWLGLMKGTLSETFVKQGEVQTRTLAADRQYTGKSQERITLKGRSMMFVRNVGHLMSNDAIIDEQGAPIFEGIMDAMITSLCALHDLQGNSPFKNSSAASINIVKPKMHGPEEVAFTNHLFAAVEDALSLPRFTLKMGIMDEERRTSANLKACIFEAKHRVVFINTGFLDRTGDEIHTSMQAGPVLPKAKIKGEPWITAYEDRNVDIGLSCGFQHKAQIGKGMWPIPDKMAMMMEQKIGHPQSGANTAWVPSPTAATLHALHYHQVDVFDMQNQLKTRQEASLTTLLTPPLMHTVSLSKEDIQAELDNNAQGILGYVVRWIDQGVGCSKVPDINHVGLMEDRATLRISSQHIANWLFHGICTKAQVESTFAKMAGVVDGQNEHDAAYQPMAKTEQGLLTNLAYQAALALVFEGTLQPNGYTEPLLHAFRKRYKAQRNV